MKHTRRLFAILLAAAMIFSILPVVALADDPVGTAAISASDFISPDGYASISNYTGTVNSVNFTGIQAVELGYQPRFYFTDAGISSIQAYASANGYDTLVIHATGANFSDNGGVINNQLWFDASEWKQLNVDIDSLTSSFDFFFSSQNSGTIYLWFEFAVLTKDSFTGAGVAITDYTGTVEGVSFTGIQAVQTSYQPRFYFTDAGISSIQAYAAANGYDTLVIHATGANFNNNGGVINNQLWFGASAWAQTSVDIDSLTSSFYFWFTSEQTGTMYLWFEFTRAPIVTTASFTNAYWNDLGNCTYSIASGDYQPHFYFSQAGIARMQAYATKWGVDTLRITATYSGTNGLSLKKDSSTEVLWVGNDQTNSVDVAIADMSTSFDIWSQSTSGTSITLGFVAYKKPLINAGSFTGPGTFSNNLDGTVGLTSGAYQPHFYFTSQAVSDIQSYAATNGYDVLRITATYTGTNNGLIVGPQWIGNGYTGSVDVSIADLSTSFNIWSQSEGTTNVTFAFEFLHPSHTWVAGASVAPTCTAAGSTTYTCSVCGATETRTVEATGHTYQAVVTAPTCTTGGYTTHTCSGCGDSYTDSATAATGHIWNDGVVTTEPTATTAGVVTYTCTACDATRTEEIPAGGHHFVGGYCTICGLSDGTDATFKIKSARLALSNDIVVIYSAAVPAAMSDPYMVFTFNGTDYTVTNGVYDEATNRYNFSFAGVTPEKMGDNICATLYATRPVGETEQLVHAVQATYSVRQYCVNQLNKNDIGNSLRTLLSDVLAYGAAAQSYTSYNADALVTSGVTGMEATVFVPVETSQLNRSETTDANIQWLSATLQCGSKMAMVFTFTTNVPETTSVKLMINNELRGVFTIPEGSQRPNAAFRVTFSGINATEFDDTVTAILLNGEDEVQTLTYSVNSYVCSKQNDSDTALQTLVRAICNYGVSAKAYSEN